MDPHRRAELRSLALHREVADRLRADQTVLARALARVVEWERLGHVTAYARAWRALLEGPQDELLSVLVSDDERGRALRQATPFAGVVSPRDRWRLWRGVGVER